MSGSAIIGREIRAAMSKTLRDTMLAAANSVTNATPVDTGHAASNWILSKGQPHTTIDGSPKAVSTVAQEKGIQEIRAYDVGRDGKIYLRNNVLYLRYLDRGWSAQAPAGFVWQAIMAGLTRAPAQHVQAVRRALRAIAHASYLRTF